MSDLYHSVANSNLGRRLLNAINLPVPVALDRWSSGQTSFIKGNVLIGTSAGGALTEAVAKALAESSAIVKFPNSSEAKDAIEKAAEKAQLSVSGEDVSPEVGAKFKGLVFDASGIENSEQLKALYDFFHPVIRKMETSGRIVVLGRPPESAETPAKATAQRSLEGFIRSVAKEVGKKGVTAHLVYVAKGAENQLSAPLRFCLSPKSAYVSAQVLRVSRGKALAKEFNWNLPLEGKVALVTGASRGIGEAIANTLARDGAKIIGLDIPQAEQDLNKVMGKLNGKSLLLDITADDAPAAISEFVKKEFGGVDVVIHNAGVTRDKTLGGMPEHFWDQVIDINLGAIERINEKLLADQAINKGGRIVAVSSMSGIAGNFGQTNYAVSKAGVIGYVQSMAPVLAKEEITINAVAPGFIETQMTAAMPFTIREAGRRMNSMSQGGLPVDVAEAIAFFSGSASNGLNGNVIRICGQSLLGA